MLIDPFFLECLAKLIMTNTLLAGYNFYLFLYVSWQPEVRGYQRCQDSNPCRDLKPRPTDLQPDAMTTRPWWPRSKMEHTIVYIRHDFWSKLPRALDLGAPALKCDKYAFIMLHPQVTRIPTTQDSYLISSMCTLSVTLFPIR